MRLGMGDTLPSARYTGYTVNGGFAEYVLAEASLRRQSASRIDPLDAAPLTCAGVTTYKAVKVSGARSSDLVAVFGIGGLGHLAIQYAHIAGATVAAVDVVDAKLDMAKTARGGLHHQRHHRRSGVGYPGAGRRRRRHRLRRHSEGLRAGLRQPAAERHPGYGRPPADNTMHLPIFETVLRGIKVVGSLVGTRVDLA